jgi:hypothetical protein
MVIRDVLRYSERKGVLCKKSDLFGSLVGTSDS